MRSFWVKFRSLLKNLFFRQIRAAHKTNEMSTALRMTEDFSEQQFADIAKEYEAQEARVRKLKEKLRNVLRIEIDIIESQL